MKNQLKVLPAYFMPIFVLVIAFITANALTIQITNEAVAADHVDAPLTTADPQIDITDVYAFLDPDDESRLVLAMAVVPFIQPQDNGNVGFDPDVLYQFKVDNDGDAVEDFVVQIIFDGSGFNQEFRVIGPALPLMTGAVNEILPLPSSIEGNTQVNVTSGVFRAYAGLADDAFVFDFSQFNAILDGSQDVFRQVTSPVLGPLDGREIRSDGTSGIDFFAGVNALHIVVSFPKNLVRGDGFFGIDGLVGIWGTTSRPDQLSPDEFVQIERMGQQVFNTVFVPEGMKDEFNAAVPAEDVAMFSGLVPDALTQVDNDGTGNTIAGRADLLEALGVTAVPNGAPLLLPPDFVHPLVPDSDLLRVALLPDYLRLDLDRNAADLAVGLFGLQNGRRPQDDVGDITFLLARQLADVNFPADSGVPGSGPPRPGALDCTILPDCPNRLVLAVLQGTDWIKPDALIADLRVDVSGNDSPFPAVGGTTDLFPLSVFNFMAVTQTPSGDGNNNGSSCSVAKAGTGSGTGTAALSFLIPGLVFAYAVGRRFTRKKINRED
ncbi:MAG: DUF4331 family protein [Deltaproteobacteria bacterium]